MTRRKYRFVSKDGRHKTRWRALPLGGVQQPSARTVARLGEQYSIEIRKARQ